MNSEMTHQVGQPRQQKGICSDLLNLPIEYSPEFGSRQNFSLLLTKHSERRFGQRGMQKHDAEIIMAIGSETSSGYMITKKDLARFERDFKQILKRIERLTNKELIVDGSVVITTYHATRKQQRRHL